MGDKIWVLYIQMGELKCFPSNVRGNVCRMVLLLLPPTSPVLSSSGNGLHGMLNIFETESIVCRLASQTSYLFWKSCKRDMASSGSMPGMLGPWESKALRNWITSTTNI